MLSQAGVNGEQKIPPGFEEVPAYVARGPRTGKAIADAVACAMKAIASKGVVIDALRDPDTLSGETHYILERIR